MTTAKGAINALMAEVLNDHIRSHMIDEDRVPSDNEQQAANELVAVLRTYIA